MFTITAHQNPYLPVGQSTMQAVLSVRVADDAAVAPASLALGIALDRSGSMEGAKWRAARDGALRVVQALDETIMFVVVAFSNQAQPIYGPANGTSAHKQAATQAIQRVAASGGTAMSTALNLLVDTFAHEPNRARQILFLTDGKNEGEQRAALDQAVDRCAASGTIINAWGVGTDWDERELRAIADRTHGDADIIPSPQEVAATFAAAFQQLRKTAISDVQLALWSPVGVAVARIEQVYPQIVPLALRRDPASPRQGVVSLGAFAAGDQRDYLLTLALTVYPPGQQFLAARPSLTFTAAGSAQTEKAAREGWVFAEWTADDAQAAQIDPQVAHYTNQEELSAHIRDGQAALARGDAALATRELTRALEISQRSGNTHITRLLGELVQQDANGTVRLNTSADAVARKTLAINVGKTSKLK